jgi:large subunit ribosomal protein L4
MEFPVLDTNGSQVDTVDLPAYIFEEDINVGLMHQAYQRQMANARQGNTKVKKRSEIRVSGAKIWRQKGTGRARHGDRGAPIFVGGGQAFGPRPRDYSQKMPKKMRQKALRCTLSALVRDDQLVILDDLSMERPKTKIMKQILEATAGSDNALVVLPEKDDNVARSVHNLPNAHVILANYLNIRDLLKYDKVVMSLATLEVIEGIWGQEA